MEENLTARIFIRACELRGEERARYLIDACDGDGELLERVVALLHADEKPLDSLEEGPELTAERLLDEEG